MPSQIDRSVMRFLQRKIPEWLAIDVDVRQGQRPRPGMISIREAARAIGITENTLFTVLKRGRGAGLKFEKLAAGEWFDGDVSRLRREAEAWAEANPENPKAEPPIVGADALDRAILGSSPWWDGDTTPSEIEAAVAAAKEERAALRDPSSVSESFWVGRLRALLRQGGDSAQGFDRILRIASSLGRSAAEALAVRDTILSMAAYRGEPPTDEQIAALFASPKPAKSVSRPATAPGTGGGFSGKLPQRERPAVADEDDDDEPPTKINPRRRG